MEMISNNFPLFLEPSLGKTLQRTLLTSIKHTHISDEGRHITSKTYLELNRTVADKVSIVI